MREDMSKVIVERARHRWLDEPGERRLYRASENLPSKIGMRQKYQTTTSFNENLAPLRRYIASQVNRPWDKVYSEICAHIDRRNTVQEHIFAHIGQFVELHARLIDGKVHVRAWNWHDRWDALDQSHVELYVHPRTGILLRNQHRKPRGWRKPVAGNQAAAPTRKMIGDFEQLLCVDGIWYRAMLETLPGGIDQEVAVQGRIRIKTAYPKCWDAVRNIEVSGADSRFGLQSAHHWFGREGVYAKSKRQLAERELRKYGLKDKGRDSRPFLLPSTARHLATVASVNASFPL